MNPREGHPRQFAGQTQRLFRPNPAPPLWHDAIERAPSRLGRLSSLHIANNLRTNTGYA